MRLSSVNQAVAVKNRQKNARRCERFLKKSLLNFPPQRIPRSSNSALVFVALRLASSVSIASPIGC
jgi:hypothetical protein